MKKRLVTYILISAMAAAVFAGCSKNDSEGDAAAADATGAEAVVTEQTALDATGTAATAAGAEVATEEIAAVEDAKADTAATGAAAEEYVDEEDTTDAAATDKPVEEEAEYKVFEPGTQYVVQFGGNVYSSPEENAANIVYFANPGDTLVIEERLENYWYKVSYWIANEGVQHFGYIQIQRLASDFAN